MKATVSLLLMLLWCSILQSQQVVATAGSTLSNSNGSMSFTIGEGVAQTFTGGDKTITQGFQQPNLLVSMINETKDIDFSITAYPNPATDILNLEIGKENVSGLQYLLFDFNGKMLKNNKLEKSLTEIPFKEMQNGIYIIRISDGTRELKTFKIIKK
jgi:hypothetical protein